MQRNDGPPLMQQLSHHLDFLHSTDMWQPHFLKVTGKRPAFKLNYTCIIQSLRWSATHLHLSKASPNPQLALGMRSWTTQWSTLVGKLVLVCLPPFLRHCAVSPFSLHLHYLKCYPKWSLLNMSCTGGRVVSVQHDWSSRRSGLNFRCLHDGSCPSVTPASRDKKPSSGLCRFGYR